MPTPQTDTLILKRLASIQIQEPGGQIKQSKADEVAKKHDKKKNLILEPINELVIWTHFQAFWKLCVCVCVH